VSLGVCPDVVIVVAGVAYVIADNAVVDVVVVAVATGW
jgi:hypothetical protein